MAIRSSSQPQWFGPGDVARRLGVSIKALRVYERAGLVAPDRREGGWRHYGPDHLERLHRIIALKALGLSLTEIRTLIDAPGVDLRSVLDLQARSLSAELAAVRERLDRVRRAQREVMETGRLDTGALIALSHTGTAARMTSKQVVAFINGLAIGVGLPEPTLPARSARAADEVELATIVAEASRLAAERRSNNGSEATRLARRWLALKMKSSGELHTNAPDV